MGGTSLAGRTSVTKLPRIIRPTVSTVRDAILARNTDSRASRQFHKLNAENYERSLHDMNEFQNGRLPFLGQLFMTKFDTDGHATDLGLVSCRVVTNAGVQFIVDAFQGLTALTDMKYHGVGTGTTAEAATQTALVTELTTQYSTSNTRPTGTTGEQSGQSNTYETTATIAVSSAVAITEHAIFSRAATGGGVMLDRSVFAAVNLASGESLQATYDLTFSAGG